MTRGTPHPPARPVAHPAPRPLPRARDVLRAQVRAVALVLRAPALVATVLGAVATAFVVAERVSGGGPVDFSPELSMVPALLGAVFPLGVWKGEERFGASLLWTLPVERRRHALMKVGAGWVWLMGVVTVFAIWLLLLAFFTGGNVLGEQTLRVLPSSVEPAPGTLAPTALRVVRWNPEPLFWIVPFTGATGTYLLASAVALGVRYPLRWVGGAVFAIMLVGIAGEATDLDWLRLAPSRLISAVHLGPYGLDALMTARSESLSTVVTLSDRRTVNVWRGLPVVREWAIATALWTAFGLLALWLAASRHREPRGT